jgi:hypothetical protein
LSLINRLTLLLLLFTGAANAGTVEITALPLGSAATTTNADVFPFVDVTANATQKMTLWDLINLPPIVATYAPINNPTFTGTTAGLNGSGANLTELNGSNVGSGIVSQLFGGTGVASTSLHTHGVPLAEGSSPYSSAAAGATGTALCGNGVSADPSFCSVVLNPMTGNGDMIYGAASGTASRLPAPTPSSYADILTYPSPGPTPSPVWNILPGNTAVLAVPAMGNLLTTGSTSGYLFVVSPANATVGATYTNNSATFTVLTTISSGSFLFTSITSGSPLSSGTLTKTGGTGDTSITFSSEQVLATFAAPAGPNPLMLHVKFVAAGGGGSEGGATLTTSANPGGVSGLSCGVNSFVGTGGGAGTQNGGGAGGGLEPSVLPAGVFGECTSGSGGGAPGFTQGVDASAVGGGVGASSIYGGGGQSYDNNTTGGSAATNSGSGGGGGGNNGSASSSSGGGGGSGAHCDLYIPTGTTAFSKTCYYTIGLGGVGGTGSANGGPGADGRVDYWWSYQ